MHVSQYAQTTDQKMPYTCTNSVVWLQSATLHSNIVIYYTVYVEAILTWCLVLIDSAFIRLVVACLYGVLFRGRSYS